MLAVVHAARSLPSLEVEAFQLGCQAPVEQAILAAGGIPSRSLDVGGLRGGSPLAFARNGLRRGRSLVAASSDPGGPVR